MPWTKYQCPYGIALVNRTTSRINLRCSYAHRAWPQRNWEAIRETEGATESDWENTSYQSCQTFLPVDLTVSKNLCVRTLHSHTKLFRSIYRFQIDKCASVAHNYQQKSRAHAHRLNWSIDYYFLPNDFFIIA